MRIMSLVDWWRVTRLAVFPCVFFAAVTWFTSASPLIAILNVMLISASVAVCIAFLPSVGRIFKRDHPIDSVDVICLGIFLAWLDWIGRASLSLTWRLVPSMRWITDTDLNSWILFFVLYAALCHLAAPAVIEGRVPSRRWVHIGIVCGVGVMIGLCAVYWDGLHNGVVQHG